MPNPAQLIPSRMLILRIGKLTWADNGSCAGTLKSLKRQYPIPEKIRWLNGGSLSDCAKAKIKASTSLGRLSTSPIRIPDAGKSLSDTA